MLYCRTDNKIMSERYVQYIKINITKIFIFFLSRKCTCENNRDANNDSIRIVYEMQNFFVELV